MNWRPILVHLAWIAGLAVVVETGTMWVCASWIWTPIQRHYLPAYIWCSLPVVPPATAETRIIWKTGLHRNRALATDEDVVDSEGGTGMKLSQSALDAGWKGLAEGPPQQFLTATLRSDLPDLAFDGESLWSFLLLPEACGLVVFFYGLYGCVRLGSRLLDWVANLACMQDRSPWQEQLPSLFDRFSEMTRGLQLRSAEFQRAASQRREMRSAPPAPIIANTTPSTKPQSFPLPLFGVYNTTGEGYLWRSDQID